MRSFRRARRSGSTGVAAAIVAVASIWVTASNAQSPFSARVVLYEEDKTSVGQSFIGSVTWQLEPASSSSDAPAIRADITIPDRRLVVTWLMQRNDDSSLPASHTISLAFKVPTDFPHLGIAELRGILMKELSGPAAWHLPESPAPSFLVHSLCVCRRSTSTVHKISNCFGEPGSILQLFTGMTNAPFWQSQKVIRVNAPSAKPLPPGATDLGWPPWHLVCRHRRTQSPIEPIASGWLNLMERDSATHEQG